MDCTITLPSLLSLEQAIDRMLLAVTPLTDIEQIPLVQAMGRITALPVISPISIPAFDNSAMDGYAVRLADIVSGQPLPIAGKSFAGAPFQDQWPIGSCLRIMTGAPVPKGAEAVIMQEQAKISDQAVCFSHAPKFGQNIRRVGEDIQQNSVVLDAGMKLGTVQLPLLASLGIVEVSVFRRLKVAIFSTGNELQTIGTSLDEGRIYDTNRLAVRLMLEQLGCEVLDLGIISDDTEALRAAFVQADSTADVVISSGGVSVGEADYTKQILDELGEISFWQLAIKPGKPFAFGKLSRAWFCGLPGNPVSAIVTFYQLVQPLLMKLSGHSHWVPPRRFTVRSADALKKSPGRLDFQRGILHDNGQGELMVYSTGRQDSHVFSSLSEGNCFIILDREQGSVAEGEWVCVEPFNSLLRS